MKKNELLGAVFVIAMLPVGKKDSEVHDIEICDRRFEASRQGPRETHQEIAT